MKKTILLLAVLCVLSAATLNANRIEIGASVGFQTMSSVAQKSKDDTTKASLRQLVELEAIENGTYLVGEPESVANLANSADLMTGADGQPIDTLNISQTSLIYSGSSFLGQSTPGVVAGGSLGYIMDIPCSPMFVNFRLGLYYYGSKTKITPSASVVAMDLYTETLDDGTYGLRSADLVNGSSKAFDVEGKLRNKLALNFEVALGASVTKNVDVTLGVGYSGVQSNISYKTASFKPYTPANNLILKYGFVAEGSYSGDPLGLETSTSKNMWLSGVSLSAAVTYKVSDSFGVRLRSEATFFAANNYAISYNPTSWATTQEEFASETQKGSLRIQNTIFQTSVELVYMMGVGSQPAAA